MTRRVAQSAGNDDAGPVPAAHMDAFNVFMDELDDAYADEPDGAWSALMIEGAERYLRDVLGMRDQAAHDQAHEAWLQWLDHFVNKGE